MRRAFATGFLIWVVGTCLIRFGGRGLLRPGHTLATLLLYIASFAVMGVLGPRICRRLKLEPHAWFEATALLCLPTLVLDPFSALFFPRVFPNLDPAAAGAFGGWMLVCCGGAFAGVISARRRISPASAPR